MTNKTFTTKKHTFRPLSELNIIDDFLFQQLITQEDSGEKFCRILLSTILGRPIRNVRITPQKNILGIDTNQYGIRLDAYIEEILENNSVTNSSLDAEIIPNIYDIEPNNHYERNTLPKRMRYYHELIDTQLLATDVDYEKLPNLVIIIILPYDPFGKNRMVYTIQNQCVEDSTLSYNDGATKIFLIYKRYGRKSWELEKMWKQEGLEEGLIQGSIALIETCQEFQLSKEETLNRIVQKFNFDTDTATAYIKKYWKD